MDVNERQEPSTAASSDAAPPVVSTQEAREYRAENQRRQHPAGRDGPHGMARGKRVPVASSSARGKA
jgi:hypothetical protein